MLTLVSLALGTLVSEDLTCISAGLLVQRGALDPVSAITACAVGILAGDIGLWAIGRVFGSAAFGWPWVARHLRTRGVDHFRDWLHAHAAMAILWSRVVPGARLPLYVVAGVARVPGTVFAWWAAVAALAWTPILVMGTAVVGEAVIARLFAAAATSWLPLVLAGGTVALLVQATRAIQRRRLP